MYADQLYELVKEEFKGLDAIYEDALIHLIGIYGLYLLREHNLIEGCGVVNGRNLYTLCDKK